MIREELHRKTKIAVLMNCILHEPIFTLYGLLVFILRKDLQASAFIISLFVMLKPVVSIFSYYWIALFGKNHKLCFFGGGILSCLPFLFFPLVSSAGYVVFSGAVYMLFYRAINPAWMEILKKNLHKEKREKVFSFGSAIGYLEGVFLAIVLGPFLDAHTLSWKWLFFIFAFLRMASLLFVMRLPVEFKEKEIISLKQMFLKPWKDSFLLMKTNRLFAKFQWGFMLAGFGIMLLQPALPIFFVDRLKISYTDLAIALSVCKGLGFAFSSPFWARALQKISLLKLSGIVFLVLGLFPFTLFFAPFHIFWIYFGFALYGIVQGGSHLIWNLSGPYFAENEDSSLYSGINVAMVGVRGMIAPIFGGIICLYLGPVSPLVFGMAFSLIAGRIVLKKESKQILLSK